MEEIEKKKRKREPKAYYYPNGVKTEFKYEGPKDPNRLSKAGMWLKEHPEGVITEILDMRAVMK
ncbi:MAG: hypothetical protein LBT25_04205 [Candidatus Symbiothrix sp.]|jgi:hypothetical protein|nr:hypothetical protein [Candidatus Symbiothrix sp.]